MKIKLDFNKAPLLVIWEITRSCALACRHCRAEAEEGRHAEELSLEEGKALLNDIKEMGTPLVVFTGGDPLQRDDLEALIAHGKSLGLRVGAIPATTPRLTRERVFGLKQAGLDQMALSIDAASAEKHDGFRRVPGCFDKAMQGVEWAQEAELPLQINTVFAAWNVDEFDELAALVERVGAVFWEVFFLVPTGRGAVMESCDAQQYQLLFNKLSKLSKRVDFIIKVTEAPQYRAYVKQQSIVGPEREAAIIKNGLPSFHHKPGGRLHTSDVGINSGKGFCFVDHIGQVCPSGFLPLVAGNLREHSISELYRNSKLFTELRDLNLLKGRCGACTWSNLCGGSRARTYALTGDYLAEEPVCVLVDATD